jgi:leucyl aminopeptidase (aminopeptidase T)
MSDDLTEPADVAAECLGVRRGERIAVLHNGVHVAIAEALAGAAERRGAEVRVVEFPPTSRPGAEPVPEVASALTWADAAFGATSISLSHTRTRIEASRRGLRFASMPTLTHEIFRRTLPVDYEWMSALGAEIAMPLTAADQCRLQSAEGTNVVLSLQGREGRNDDGNLRAAGAFGNLPAGEAYIAPVETAGEGTIVFDGALTGYGILDEPLVVELRDGAVTAAHGLAADYLLATLDSGGPGGRHVAELGIGTNPAAQIVGVVLEDEKVLGTAHIAFGSSTGVGGVNQSSIHLDGILRRPTVTIGDDTVLDAGRVVRAEERVR